MTRLINNLNKSNFYTTVANSDKPILIDFWAPWCGPCRQVAPILENLAFELGDQAKIAKVNVDDEPELAEEFGVRSIPTLVVMLNGKEVDRLIGFQGPETIKAILFGKIAKAS